MIDRAYYNEIEEFCCEVIETNIARGRIPGGRVDQRDIKDVEAAGLIRAGFSQYHLFAGIGGAAYACRLAGVPDRFSIGTMGFPCQDISCAGAQEGIGGERSGLFFQGCALFGEWRKFVDLGMLNEGEFWRENLLDSVVMPKDWKASP